MSAETAIVFPSFARSENRAMWHGVREDGRTGCGMLVMPTDVTTDDGGRSGPLEGQPFCSRCALYEAKRTPLSGSNGDPS